MRLEKLKEIGQSATSVVAKSGGKLAQKAKSARKNKTSDSGEHYVVGLDIGTEYVKALIAKVGRDNASAEIIGVGRAHQALTDIQAGAISDIASVVENCDQALNAAEQQAGISVRSCVIGIAGELVKGTTTTVKISRREANKPLDLVEMEKIVRLVQERAEAKAKQQLSAELGGKEVGIKLVNSALVSITIDGYPVTNPIGFQGRDVLVQLYTAFAPLIHIGALEKTAEELDLDLLAVAAEPFAVARSVIGDKQGSNFDAILMDVGGGTTDIAVVADGGVQGTKMFGIGGRAFTHSIERELGVEFPQAEQLKLGLASGKDPSAKVKDIETALNKTLKVWASGVELSLGEFTKLDNLPHKLYLCGGGSSLEGLVDKLDDSDWYTKLPFTKKPLVTHINPDQVVGIYDKTGDVTDHTFITAMGLVRVGLDTLQFTGGDASGSIREKIDRMLRV